MPTDRKPAHGELWESREGRLLLVVQHNPLIVELPTVVCLVATDIEQLAPEPVRVRLSPDDTGLALPLWIKVPLVVTVEAETLARYLASPSDSSLRGVLGALQRVLNLGDTSATTAI